MSSATASATGAGAQQITRRNAERNTSKEHRLAQVVDGEFTGPTSGAINPPHTTLPRRNAKRGIGEGPTSPKKKLHTENPIDLASIMGSQAAATSTSGRTHTEDPLNLHSISHNGNPIIKTVAGKLGCAICQLDSYKKLNEVRRMTECILGKLKQTNTAILRIRQSGDLKKRQDRPVVLSIKKGSAIQHYALNIEEVNTLAEGGAINITDSSGKNAVDIQIQGDQIIQNRSAEKIQLYSFNQCLNNLVGESSEAIYATIDEAGGGSGVGAEAGGGPGVGAEAGAGPVYSHLNGKKTSNPTGRVESEYHRLDRGGIKDFHDDIKALEARTRA